MLVRCSLLVCLFGWACARDVTLDDLWGQFKVNYGKTYSDTEDQQRRAVWEENVRAIQQHNLHYDLGTTSFSTGLNEYSDLTLDEYRHYLLGARRELSTRHSSRLVYEGDRTGRDLPDHVDWRDQGYVTPIKDQGQCGSCWAFSSTGAMEGAHFKATGRLVSLSEQQLVDCCKENAGCNGGWMDNAFDYVVKNGGIDTETYYPYQAYETGRCTYNPNDVGANISSWVDVKSGDEDALKAAVATVGPVAVAIDATKQSFMNYRQGVYFEPTCSHNITDHAVLVVGYGTDSGKDYWLVKNSWGTSWGMEGYIMMARNNNNMCAIASFASYPQDNGR